MKRITHSTAVADLPTPADSGTTGYFGRGDIGAGIPPTTLTADWANRVQEEIAGTIEAAGLTLDGSNNGQLLQAIIALSSKRNVLINPGMNISWMSNIAAGATGLKYNVSHWYGLSSGSTYAYDWINVLPAESALIHNSPTLGARLTVTSVNGAGNMAAFGQCIEGVNTLSGGTASLSFWARLDAAADFSVELRQHFGSGGSPSADVTGIGAHKFTAPDTNWNYYTLEGISVPSLSGKTIGSSGGDYLDLRFWVDAGSDFNSRTGSLGQQSRTFDITMVNLIEGIVAMPAVLGEIEQERYACARYYENDSKNAASSGPGLNPEPCETMLSVVGASTATQWGRTIYFYATKRATPTVTIFNPATGATNNEVRDRTAAADCSATTVADITMRGFNITFITSASTAAGNALTCAWAADAEYSPTP